MNYTTNPFQELYVTDSPDPKSFVRLFSDFPVKSAPALFRPGNVVLKGTQGSGKSMLLNLLKPQIRSAYAQAGVAFPLPSPLDKFIGAGINLTRSGILDIGQRPLDKSLSEELSVFPLFFADFLNYYVVRDLLSSLELMRAIPKAYSSFVHNEHYDTFAKQLARQDCWFGFLAGTASFEDLCKRIDERITSYRAFHQYNGQLSEQINNTKTNIGEPIARAADCLREVGVIAEDTPVLIRIDQVERLLQSDVLRRDLGTQYRRVINKALGTRDSRVFYRIGTRKYAWDVDLTIFGTQDKLEHIRDFRIIDLDDILQRKEDTKAWIFPDFAKDAFHKRLEAANYDNLQTADPITQLLGSSDDPTQSAKNYAGKSIPDRILKLADGWSSEWKVFLEELYKSSPLDAILAAAWGQQTNTDKNQENRKESPPREKVVPWAKIYWRKERIRLALLQIAARAQQRLKWSGKDHILGLSAGNISIFLSICHEIWDVLLRAERRKHPNDRINPEVHGVHRDVQALGVQTSSSYWYHKITEQPNGDDRKRFVDVLGPLFRNWLVNDLPMSYPGRNGFSLLVSELETFPLLKKFLDDAVNYGDLVDAPHTTKQRDRKQRRKFYLNPILSDFFQIPESHTKEPYYASASDLLKWLKEAGVVLGGGEEGDGTSETSSLMSSGDLPLFESKGLRL